MQTHIQDTRHHFCSPCMLGIKLPTNTNSTFHSIVSSTGLHESFSIRQPYELTTPCLVIQTNKDHADYTNFRKIQADSHTLTRLEELMEVSGDSANNEDCLTAS